MAPGEMEWRSSDTSAEGALGPEAQGCSRVASKQDADGPESMSRATGSVT
jgi:hypothetical protein